MKLFYSKTSPYVRRVRVAAIELGLAEQLELIEVNPHESPDELLAANPLSKIPALQLENGQTLCGSALIIDYLDSITSEPSLMPAGNSRWEVLGLVEIAEGIIDAAVLLFMEYRKPAQRQHQPWIELQRNTILRALDTLENEHSVLDASKPGMYDITLGCALAYLDFRHTDLQWRAGHVGLATWYELMAQRPAMQITRPPE